MLESALVYYRTELVSVTKGKPASVEFDFDAIWAFRKTVTMGFDSTKFTWVHVHPSSFGVQPSFQDVLCAQSLQAAFGPLGSFRILCFQNPGFKDIAGQIASYSLKGDSLVHTWGHNIDLGLHDEHAYLLKALSYGDLWKTNESQFMDLGPSVPTSLSS